MLSLLKPKISINFLFNISHQFIKKNHIHTSGVVTSGQIAAPCYHLCKTASVMYQSQRHAVNFITTKTADELWESVTSVSNAGRKRGRGKSARKKPRLLYAGNRLGEGKANMNWPGLNSIILDRGNITSIRVKDTEYVPPPVHKDIRHRSRKLPALQRGFCGSGWPGRSLGPPDPVGDYNFEGFESKVLMLRVVRHMTGDYGQVRSFKALVVTGNRNGLAGYALAKSKNAEAAVNKAKNYAGQRLQYVERFEDHTVFHNFSSTAHHSTLHVRKEAKGYGLHCHRVLKCVCEMIGIKDIHIVLDGGTRNFSAVTKAFFSGLFDQETHQKLADRMKLHVVEFRKERNYMPVVVASPTVGETRQIADINDISLDFDRIHYGDKVPLIKKKPPPFFINTEGHQRHLFQKYRIRNQPQAQLDRIVAGLQPEIKEINKAASMNKEISDS